MIGAHRPTKRYGATTAVEDVSFTNCPGIVTGFPGPRHHLPAPAAARIPGRHVGEVIGLNAGQAVLPAAPAPALAPRPGPSSPAGHAAAR